jgi:hypothetical protein
LSAINGRFLSGAVIVGIFLNFAGFLDELPFGFGGIETTTLTTANKAGKGKGVLLRPGLALFTH